MSQSKKYKQAEAAAESAQYLVGGGELGGVVEGVDGAGVGQVVVQVLQTATYEVRNVC